MGGHKKYSGYKSFQYLTPHLDYASYPLEKEIDRFPPYDFGLSKTQEERVQGIIEKNMIVSMHEHLEVFPDKSYTGPKLRRGDGSQPTKASLMRGSIVSLIILWDLNGTAS